MSSEGRAYALVAAVLGVEPGACLPGAPLRGASGDNGEAGLGASAADLWELECALCHAGLIPCRHMRPVLDDCLTLGDLAEAVSAGYSSPSQPGGSGARPFS